MKNKLVIILFMLFGVFCSINAQTYMYRSTSFAYKTTDSYGNWTGWSAWEPSDVTITIDFDNDIVNIYSKIRQKYVITRYVRNYIDSSNGKQIEYEFVDQDGDRGNMRLRIEANGNSQIYIDFSNIMWVYNVARINN